MQSLIQFNCQILTQARDIITLCERHNVDYATQVGPHLRHVVEHYQLLLAGLEHGHVDYEQRIRGGDLETCPILTLQAIESIETTLQHIKAPADTPIQTEFAVGSIGQDQVATLSSFGRELQFMGLHAIHHYAYLAKDLSAAGIPIPTGFGLAPGTRRFTLSDAGTASAA